MTSMVVAIRKCWVLHSEATAALAVMRRIEEHRPQGHQRAEEDQDAAELAEQLLDVALRGQDLQIHHAKGGTRGRGRETADGS
jgi:hypothetical protein